MCHDHLHLIKRHRSELVVVHSNIVLLSDRRKRTVTVPIKVPAPVVGLIPGTKGVVAGDDELTVDLSPPHILEGVRHPVVVRAFDEDVVTVEAACPLHRFGVALEPTEVADVDRDIVLPDLLVVHLDQDFIHHFHAGEGPLAVVDDLRVAVVLICCEEVHLISRVPDRTISLG